MTNFTIEEYTKEEKQANGNMLAGGKLHDKILTYLENEGYKDESLLNDISVGVWKAIESMNPIIEKQSKIIKELKRSNEFYANGNGNDEDDNEYMKADDTFPFAGEQMGKLARKIKRKVEKLENENKN